jgi:hypothetical protein
MELELKDFEKIAEPCIKAFRTVLFIALIIGSSDKVLSKGIPR